VEISIRATRASPRRHCVTLKLDDPQSTTHCDVTDISSGVFTSFCNRAYAEAVEINFSLGKVFFHEREVFARSLLIARSRNQRVPFPFEPSSDPAGACSCVLVLKFHRIGRGVPRFKVKVSLAKSLGYEFPRVVASHCAFTRSATNRPGSFLPSRDARRSLL